MGYRRKFRILLVIVVFGLFAVYQFAISKTIKVGRDNKALITEMTLVEDNTARFVVASKRLKHLDSIILNHGIRKDSQNSILREISLLAIENKVRVKNVTDIKIQKNKNFELKGYRLKLEGSFVSLVRIIWQLEKKTYLGRIASASFLYERNGQNKNRKLYCNIVMQSYESIK